MKTFWTIHIILEKIIHLTGDSISILEFHKLSHFMLDLAPMFLAFL